MTTKYPREKHGNLNQVLDHRIFVQCIFTSVFLFPASPIEEVTDALYGKWRHFMMTHNLELKMPDILFDGATVRITPRAFEGEGTLFKLEMIPKAFDVDSQVDGRLFGLKKKISKTFHFLKSKCTHPLPSKSRPGKLAHSYLLTKIHTRSYNDQCTTTMDT